MDRQTLRSWREGDTTELWWERNEISGISTAEPASIILSPATG